MKHILDNFRSDFDHAMKSLEEKYNVSIKLGTIRYGDTDFTSRIEVQSADHKPETYGYGDIIGKTFDVRGDIFTIVEVKPRSPKFPIIATCKGVRYKFQKSILTKVL